jgi:hypothetical protein
LVQPVANGFYVKIHLIGFFPPSHYDRIDYDQEITPISTVSHFSDNAVNQFIILSNGAELPPDASGFFREYHLKVFFNPNICQNQIGLYHQTQDIPNLVRVCASGTNFFLVDDEIPWELSDEDVVDCFNGNDDMIKKFFRNLLPSMMQLFNQRISLRSLTLSNCFAQFTSSLVRVRFIENCDEESDEELILHNIYTLGLMAAQLYLNDPFVNEEDILLRLEAAGHLSPSVRGFIDGLLSFDEYKVVDEQYDYLYNNLKIL